MEPVLLDAAGRRRSPATMPGFHTGRPPRNKGLRYPPDPPSVEEIIAVMQTAGDSAEGLRLRALIVFLWRAGLRISEALALAESDLDPIRGAAAGPSGEGRQEARGRNGPPGVRAAAAMARAPHEPPRGRIVVRAARSDCGPAVAASAAREGCERRPVVLVFAAGSLHTSSGTLTLPKMAREGIPITVIQRQLGMPISA